MSLELWELFGILSGSHMRTRTLETIPILREELEYIVGSKYGAASASPLSIADKEAGYAADDADKEAEVTGKQISFKALTLRK